MLASVTGARLSRPRDFPGSRFRLVSVERAREEVARCQAAERPPLLGKFEDLVFGREPVELVRIADGLPQGKVSRQRYVFTTQRNEEHTLSCPRTDPGDRGERSDEVFVVEDWQMEMHSAVDADGV
jgi:hypothetical protein